ncbi:Outer membrane porin F precursor [Pseudoalteromonas sp. THAF3]|uniref:OmpA family protein n=1 Tax=Pseudoalteromonas sp. THAF3 TaxID=2587843 RepID=UPI0012689B63|nr:OmpA family protein [Pseudoalteromonas sp. THAF3]QFU06076.1 Outer membrane porin F precursor [Pseudoalteromonas sp. THAF3]
MKIKSLSAAIVLAFATQGVMADEQTNPQEGLHIGVFGDYFWADWDRIDGAPVGTEIGESFGSGVEVGYRFNEYWTARLEFAALELDIENTDNHKTGERYGADVLYHFNDTVYGVLGAKKFDVYNDFNAANLGVGFRHHLTYNWAAYGEANYYEGLNQNHSDFGLKLGLSYHFGDKPQPKKVEPAPEPVVAPVVKEEPKDSDKDGVIDARDNCANTPMTDAVDENGCTRYMEKGDKVSLLVRFPHDNSDVNQRYFDDIQEVADFMKEYPKTTVLLEGHASAVGDAAYNKTLSKKRADHVANQLIDDGIAESRINTAGFGEERLLNDANTAQAHAQNRRVEAHISVTERVKVNRN